MNRREIALQILCAKLANPKLTTGIKQNHYVLYIKEAFELADKFLKFYDNDRNYPV